MTVMVTHRSNSHFTGQFVLSLCVRSLAYPQTVSVSAAIGKDMAVSEIGSRLQSLALSLSWKQINTLSVALTVSQVDSPTLYLLEADWYSL